MKQSIPVLAFCALAVALVLVNPASSFAQKIPSITWVQLSPASSPSPRDVSAMAYDPASGKVVMFGGVGDNGYLNDTWTFDGTNWTQQNTAVVPSPRTSAMMAYDFGTRNLVLFGGYDGSQFLGDTWLWDGTTSTWTQANPATSPTASAGTMLFTDPKNGHADLYGGWDGRRYHLDTWRWLNGNWKKLSTATSPYARAWGLVALDLARKDVFINGGIADLRTDNTWTFDGTDWTQLSPAHEIPKIFNAGSAYDPELHGIVIFGGDEGGGAMNATQGWTGSDFLQLQPLQTAPAREFHGMAYDFGSHQMLIFGGDNGVDYLSDTWVLVRQ